MRNAVTPKFVEIVPDRLQDGVLYVSMEYATAVHRCLCGCGKEVVTPLSTTDWSLTFDGDTVSLDPSVGNWGFPCRSHYWIRNNQVLWCGDMPQSLINAGRALDARDKAAYYATRGTPAVKPPPLTKEIKSSGSETATTHTPQAGVFSRLAKWMAGAWKAN